MLFKKKKKGKFETSSAKTTARTSKELHGCTHTHTHTHTHTRTDSSAKDFTMCNFVLHMPVINTKTEERLE